MTFNKPNYETDEEKINYLLDVLADMGFTPDDAEVTVQDRGYDVVDPYGYEILVLTDMEEYAQTKSEIGHDRLTVVCNQVDYYNLPDELAMYLFQDERDRINNRMFTRPEDWEELLFIEQEIHERELEDTSDIRRKLWDELLKYTEYRTEAKIGGVHEFTKTRMSRSSTKAENKAVQSMPEDIRLENNVSFETTPVRRFFPETEPLPDLEDFVYYL